jgi:hypothetical protein
MVKRRDLCMVLGKAAYDESKNSTSPSTSSYPNAASSPLAYPYPTTAKKCRSKKKEMGS